MSVFFFSEDKGNINFVWCLWTLNRASELRAHYPNFALSFFCTLLQPCFLRYQDLSKLNVFLQFLFKLSLNHCIFLICTIVYQVIVAASKKTICLRIVCACMNRNLPWSGSRAKQYIERHSNTIFSLVRLIHLTAEIRVQYCYNLKYICLALEPVNWGFLFKHAQTIPRQ